MSYAEGTSVPVERSRAELVTILTRHGATSSYVGSDDVKGEAYVGFALAGRHVRLTLPLPKLAEFEIAPRKRGQYSRTRRTPDQQRKAHEQASRERWRAVVLLTKAKLELVTLGVSTFEREFLADVLLPDGRTVHEALRERIEESYATGKMPPLLGPAREGSEEP